MPKKTPEESFRSRNEAKKKSPLQSNLEAFERDLQQVAEKYKHKLPLNSRFLLVLVGQTHDEPCQPADGCIIMGAAMALAETITGYVVDV